MSKSHILKAFGILALLCIVLVINVEEWFKDNQANVAKKLLTDVKVFEIDNIIQGGGKKLHDLNVRGVLHEHRSSGYEETIKKNYMYNVDENLLSKLSQEDMVIEYLTDPLPYSTHCKEKAFLLIVIVSTPENFKRRESIRDSWANIYEQDVLKLNYRKPFPDNQAYAPNNVIKVVFVTGKSKNGDVMSKLQEEAEREKDILFGRMMEHYSNLTLKTRLLLKWSYYDCNSAFLLKTDDDVFINPVRLVEWLKGGPQENLYTGFCNSNSPVVRQPESKWYVSPEDYSASVYPPYCLGGGYLMSYDILARLLKYSYGKRLFPFEDLYVGIMLNDMGVSVRDERKHFDLVYTGRESLCNFNSLFLAHRVLENSQKKLLQQCRNALVNC